MTQNLAELVDVACRFATEHETRLVIRASTSDGRWAGAQYAGTIMGPYCAHARTLATDFRVTTFRDAATASTVGEIVVVDPCYWTPQLPFLYKLEMEVRLADGATVPITRWIGLRRWQAAGGSFRLERERVVLRGAAISSPDAALLPAARESEVALLVRAPNDDFCHEASRLGVAVVADMRGSIDEEELVRISRHAAVLVVLLEDDTSVFAAPSLARPLFAAAVCGAKEPAEAYDLPSWANVFAVELNADERPPAWIDPNDKPVIAIRRGATYGDFQQARAACDRLQAELAPEFNLAGYFVATE